MSKTKQPKPQTVPFHKISQFGQFLWNGALLIKITSREGMAANGTRIKLRDADLVRKAV